MIKNEVIHKVMKDMVTYLSPYQLIKLKTTLQNKLEDVEINLILDKEKLNADRNSNANLLKMFISAKDVEGCSSKTLKYYREILEKFIKDIDKAIKDITTDEIRHYLTNYKEERVCSLKDRGDFKLELVRSLFLFKKYKHNRLTPQRLQRYYVNLILLIKPE